MLEASLYSENLFVTLTYDDEHLPSGATLVPVHMTNYVKILRKEFPLRYFYVGEYGTKGERPHYHIILFGVSHLQEEIIRSKWKYGFSLIGVLTPGGSRYVSGYVVKGMNKNHKGLNGRFPEFMRCSNRPGIGKMAVEEIGKQLSKSPWVDEMKHADFLQYGKARRPLGRYLTRTLESYLPGAEARRKSDYLDYQKNLIYDHMPKKIFYRDSILEEHKPERDRKIAVYKFFKKDGCL
jgi:hypothetical protein